MGKSIFEKQQGSHFINLHLAKDRLYILAERYWQAGFWLSLIFSISLLVCYLLGLDFWNNVLQAVVGLFGLVLADFFKGYSEKKKKQAARIQEQIDTELFMLPWNNALIPQGKVNPDIIQQAALKSKKNPERFKTWYSEGTANESTHYGQVLKCQRENLSFDYLLRKKFTGWLFWLFAVPLALLCIYGLVKQLSFDLFVLQFILPLSGFLYFVIRSWSDNRKTIAEQEIMEQSVRYKLQKLANNNTSIDENDLREVQDFIYRTRSAQTIVPNAFYKLYRKKLDTLIINTSKMLN